MGVLKAVSVADIKSVGAIRDADVVKLKRAFYDDGQIEPSEAEALIEINDSCPTQDPGWASSFVEMLTDYIVNQTEPEGYLTSDNAQWLIARVAKDGTIATRTELELLINVIDKARWSPASLVTFTLEQVRIAVVSGTGPIRHGLELEPGRVGEADVDLLRRILYAYGGDCNIAISRAEAEVLFAINDATAEAANDPAWRDLFVKAIANCVMAASGYAAPSREEALAREHWLNRRGELSLGNVVGGMAGGLVAIIAGYRAQSPEEQAIARLERQKVEIVTGEEVTPAEADWLASRIGRDGRITENEKALLAFFDQESPVIAPVLREVVGRTKSAA